MSAIKLCHHIPGRLRVKVLALADYPSVGHWLKTSLLAVPGINHVRLNSTIHSVTIEYDQSQLSAAQIEARLDQLDWQAAESGEEEEYEYTQGDILLNAFGMLHTLFLPGHWAALATYPLILPQLAEGASQLAKGKLNIEALDAVAIGLSAFRGDYTTAMFTQTLLSLGEYMEQATSRNSDQLLADLMKPQISQVWVERDAGLEQISSDQLQTGDRIRLGPGDPIPADGKIITGDALVNQSALTGESVPVRREESAYLMAGTTIAEGNITLEVEQVGSEATTSRIAKLIFESLSQKSEMQEVTQQMADRRVKITLAVGALVFALTRDPERLASVFLVDYSCALKLSTPVTFKSIMYKAAREGIVIKGGHAIEQLAAADTVVFDKTGTLTHGEMQVTDVISLVSDNDAKTVLAKAASVEEHSNHPLAQAVVDAAQQHNLPHIDHGEVEYIIAHGLKSTLAGQTMKIGSRHYLEVHENVCFDAAESHIRSLEEQGKHQLYVAKKGVLIGIIALRDTLREDVSATLEALREAGIKQLVMLSGDTKAKAEQLGAELGLDRVYAEATPESKSEIVAQLQAEGRKVIFVGDGVNDGPALSAAEVGIAMNQGTEMARQTADIVLMQDSLHGVAQARLLALEAMALINSNIRITETVNTGIMMGAALGWLKPAISALLHNGTTLSILARAAAVKN